MLPIIVFPGIFETLNSPLLQIYDAYTDQEGKGEHPSQDTDKAKRDLFFHKSIISSNGCEGIANILPNQTNGGGNYSISLMKKDFS